ncbi:MAG: ATP-binding protein [Alphaproteobacteria bacterium]
MSLFIRIFGIVIIFSLWGSCVVVLGTYIKYELISILAFFFLNLLSLSFILLLLFNGQRTKRIVNKMKLIRCILHSLKSYDEIFVFNNEGKVIFTINSNVYANIKDFIKDIFARFASFTEIKDLKAWLLQNVPGEFFITDKKQSYWIFKRVFYTSSKLTFFSISDISSYFSPYQKLKKQYKHLEFFLDQAPFGLFYTDALNNIVALNTTFANFIGLDKKDILGKSIECFIESPVNDQEIISVTLKSTLKSHKKGAAKAIILQPPYQTSLKVSFVFYTNQFLLPTKNNPCLSDILNQPSFEQAPIPAVMIKEDGKIVAFNFAFASTVHYDSDTNTNVLIGGSLFQFIHNSMRNDITTKFQQLDSKNNKILQPFEVRFENSKNYATAYVSFIKCPVHNKNEIIMVQFIDISEQKRLKQQFIQSQKMQAIGQLAGGIAHDFNNLLTAMIGFCDLLLQRYMPNHPSFMDIIQIKQNANRAANLVRQLLAFSRRQNLQPKIINITDTLSELSALLRRLIGAGIELQVIHSRSIWQVKVDESQFEQVIINLAVNARDAMPNGGTLIIRTENYQLKKPYRIRHDVIPPGDYALVEVIDTGEGILQENLDRIFEPFFSTKETGYGTGLGLSTVYGIVKQTEGFVHIESEINKGTIFKLFLPRYKGVKLIQEKTEEKSVGDLTGSETILLVEDEDAVRLFSSRALREKGYRVIEASSGEIAIELIEKGEEKIDLLITDIIMPKMNGTVLNDKVKKYIPNIKTIFISGYAEETFHGNLDKNVQFLAKPFTLKDLAIKVKEVLNELK